MRKKSLAAIVMSATLLFTYNSPYAFSQETSSSNQSVSEGNSFTFNFGPPESSQTPYAGSVGAGSCTGNFANPRVEAGNIIGYGIHVTCTGSGYLPLDVQLELQEEHFGFFYQTVDRASMRLHSGYGFVRGEAFCNPDQSGHDYRISATINAGNHRGTGLSNEVHLPCDVG